MLGHSAGVRIDWCQEGKTHQESSKFATPLSTGDTQVGQDKLTVGKAVTGLCALGRGLAR